MFNMSGYVPTPIRYVPILPADVAGHPVFIPIPSTNVFVKWLITHTCSLFSVSVLGYWFPQCFPVSRLASHSYLPCLLLLHVTQPYFFYVIIKV